MVGRKQFARESLANSTAMFALDQFYQFSEIALMFCLVRDFLPLECIVKVNLIYSGHALSDMYTSTRLS